MFILQYLITVLGGQPNLFSFDFVEFHKTKAILTVLHYHDIILSIIPSGCTSLNQPINFYINKSFKNMGQDLTNLIIEQRVMK